MKMTPQEFRDWPTKRVTLLAMSGVGKTTLAAKLPKDTWFHYSGDYRIGTRYLDEPILDNIKKQAMEVPFLRELLRSDSIYISSNITVENLAPVSSFLGKLGNPSMGGLSLVEFKRRQALHRQAEIAAMLDVPVFACKAEEIYGYRHFINDAGGSVCELDAPEVIDALASETVIIYIKATQEQEQMLIDRAHQQPKPLYYREEFLSEKLAEFFAMKGLDSVNDLAPDEFVTWVFPELFHARLPRYQAIADDHGYTVSADEAAQVNNEADFIELIAQTMTRTQLIQG